MHPLSLPCPSAPYPKDDPSARRLARNKRRNSSLAIKQQDKARARAAAASQKGRDEGEEDKVDDEEGEEDEEGEGKEMDGDADAEVNEEEEDADLPVHVGEAYFPLEALERGGEGLKTEGWAERLFREEDMKPHKNFAYCR